MHGTHELDVTAAPAHALGDRQGRQRVFGHGADELGHGTTGDARLVGQPFAVVATGAAECLEFDAAGTGEAQGRLGRIAGRVEGRTQRRTAARLDPIRLPGGERIDLHRQASRRGVGRDVAELESRAAQSLGHADRERAGELGQGLGRQLFGADLDQQGRVHAASAGVCSSGKPSASRAAW